MNLAFYTLAMQIQNYLNTLVDDKVTVTYGVEAYPDHTYVYFNSTRKNIETALFIIINDGSLGVLENDGDFLGFSDEIIFSIVDKFLPEFEEAKDSYYLIKEECMLEFTMLYFS